MARTRSAPGPLRDVLVDRPRILFVGINPSLASAEAGHHFASKANPFWRLLHAAGLIPTPLTSDEDTRLAELGLALTNLCPRATRAAAELEADEMESGRRALARKIARLHPRVVAFVGVTIYTHYFKRPASEARQPRRRPPPSPKAGPKPERIAGARVFVVPNPSGLNASYPGFQHKLVWFEALRDFALQEAPLPE